MKYVIEKQNAILLQKCADEINNRLSESRFNL